MSEIDAHKYKELSVLFYDKKFIIIDQINKDIEEYNCTIPIGLSIQFFKDGKDGTRKYIGAQRHGEQSNVLDGSNVNEFYINQVLDLESWTENFISNETGTGAEIDHCIKLYSNVAKYKPVKGSSYFLLPKVLTNKKAIIHVKNEDNECLRLLLIFLLYFLLYTQMIGIIIMKYHIIGHMQIN